ncbi:hypothetical protein ESA_02434 [Cronobacter sakazakii ATCC BAA-894]|uniref:Uncharacterized protein n=1 Tax=Cronobacter sakazakii (strain ATCC BAA-894) TaxID=290339 RepID=A7MES6_CROS8|nr:hypothetical protein ESA_02434 [Cronobacter sakazakii ATCC BAA-894]
MITGTDAVIFFSFNNKWQACNVNAAHYTLHHRRLLSFRQNIAAIVAECRRSGRRCPERRAAVPEKLRI